MLERQLLIASRAPRMSVNPNTYPHLSVFPSKCILVRSGIAGSELTDIFMLPARGPSDGQKGYQSIRRLPLCFARTRSCRRAHRSADDRESRIAQAPRACLIQIPWLERGHSIPFHCRRLIDPSASVCDFRGRTVVTAAAKLRASPVSTVPLTRASAKPGASSRTGVAT